MYLCGKALFPSSASFGLAVSSQVDILGVRYKSIQVGAEKNPGSPNSNRLRRSKFPKLMGPNRLRQSKFSPPHKGGRPASGVNLITGVPRS